MRLKLKPKDPAAVLRDPHTKRPLDAEGTWVKDSQFWQRRIAAKEVEVLETRENEQPKKGGDAPAEDVPASEDAAPKKPTGLEPTTPLTTRGRLPLPGGDR